MKNIPFKTKNFLIQLQFLLINFVGVNTIEIVTPSQLKTVSDIYFDSLFFSTNLIRLSEIFSVFSFLPFVSNKYTFRMNN